MDRLLSWLSPSGKTDDESLRALQTALVELSRDRSDLAEKIEKMSAEVAAIHQALRTAGVPPSGEVQHHPLERGAEACQHHTEAEAFSNHYVEWRQRRIDAIVRHYGAEFFAGKRVLELGCGYGDLGAAFVPLGSHVTCSDARPEHLDVVRKRHPEVRTVPADLDRAWPFEGRWDLVLHLGLLYHLRAPEPSIRWACAATRHLVLETEVCDSLDPRLILRTQESGYDQAFNGCGCRPSTGCIEIILAECGATFERLRDASCNSGMHVYDWTELNTGAWRHGLRRLWFVDTTSPNDAG